MTGPAEAEETVRKQLGAVEKRLVVEFGGRLSPEAIRRAIHDELHRDAHAPLKQFIPVLVARAARDRLERGHHTTRRAG